MLLLLIKETAGDKYIFPVILHLFQYNIQYVYLKTNYFYLILLGKNKIWLIKVVIFISLLYSYVWWFSYRKAKCVSDSLFLY